MVKVSQFSVTIFTHRMLWFFTLSKEGHVSWLFTEPESLKWTVSHRGQLEDKYLYVASLKSSRKTERHWTRNSQSPNTAGLQSTCGSLLLCASPRSSPLWRPAQRWWRGGQGGHGDGGRCPGLTGVMRMAACAPQPCMARCSVSLNMLRSSTAWQYTASIRGHQSSADCKARAALTPSQGSGATEAERDQPSPQCSAHCYQYTHHHSVCNLSIGL